jgi:2-phosphosulfolactate phosphatase
MNVSILKGLPGCEKAKGVAVVIDVFRATSTIVCLTLSRPKSLIVAGTLEKIPNGYNSVLFSEIPGLKAKYDNSPLDALSRNFDGKVLTIHSLNGTTAINAVRHCDSVIIGSFLNADAVVEYLRKIDAQEVSIIPIGHIRVPEETEEDNACADYIKDKLTGVNVDIEEYRSRLRERIVIRRTDPLSPQGDQIEEDLAFCSMIGIFDVVPKVVFHEDDTIEIVAKSIRHVNKYKDDVFSERINYGVLTVEQIAEIAQRLSTSHYKVKNGHLDRELAKYCARLILLSKGRIQKALSYIFAFFNGYTEKRRIEWKLEPFMRFVLESLMSLLYREPALTEDLTNESRAELIKRIVHTFRDCPGNMPAFITMILGTGRSNYGRLAGQVVPTTQIIYHKRDTGEFSINITNECPNSCRFCIRDFKTGWADCKDCKEQQNLYLEREPTKEEVLEEVRDELERWPTGCLVKICGYGEPVLRMDIVLAIIDLIKAFAPPFTVQLNTSGWPLLEVEDDNVFETLRRHGLDDISVSLNSPNKELYDQIVRPGCFDPKEDAYEKTIKCIELARDHGFGVKATFVLTSLIKKHEEACIKLANELGAEYVGREYVRRGHRSSQLQDQNDESVIETEAKVLNIDRDEIISTLVKIGAKHTTTGITKIYQFDIPDDEKERIDILNVIKRNKPELRQIHPILAIIKKRIEDKTKLIDKLGLLRIIVEKDMTILEYQEPVEIGVSIKKEKEYSLEVRDKEDAMMFVNTIGLHLFRFSERNRERYILDQIYFDVDTWPKLGTYLKVASVDEIELFRGLNLIGISPNKATGVHAEDLFKAKGISLEYLKFSDAELKQLVLVRLDSELGGA